VRGLPPIRETEPQPAVCDAVSRVGTVAGVKISPEMEITIHRVDAYIVQRYTARKKREG